MLSIPSQIDSLVGRSLRMERTAYTLLIVVKKSQKTAGDVSKLLSGHVLSVQRQITSAPYHGIKGSPSAAVLSP